MDDPAELRRLADALERCFTMVLPNMVIDLRDAAAILRSLAEVQPEQPQPEQPSNAHLAAPQTGPVRGDTGREPEAFEAGTVAEWREATMADLMGLADEYAYRASLADADPDAGGCGPIASELAEQAARDELEDAMRIALSDRAAPLGLSS